MLIQSGIYAGFTASEEALAVAGAVFAERGLDPPDTARLGCIVRPAHGAGRAVLKALHGSRGYQDMRRPTTRSPARCIRSRFSTATASLHRPGLDRRQRALSAVAAFTALRLEGQVRKFGQSALNAGQRSGRSSRP